MRGKRLVVCVAVLVLIMSILTMSVGCSFQDYAGNEAVNLFEKATFTNLDGSKTSLSKKHAAGEGIIVTLDAPAKINTIVLGEKNKGIKSNITGFDLYSWDSEDNEWEKFYTQDIVEQYRYCTFSTVTTDKIKLMVTSTEDNREWNLKKFTGHLIENTYNKDFRVMGYAVAGYAYNGVDEPQIFDVVTHLNIFKHLVLKADGSVVFEDKVVEEDGKKTTIDGETYFAQELDNLIEARGNRNTKFIVTILGGSEENHTSAFENSSKVISDINALYEKYPAIDGVAFDYEYPYTSHANKAYGKFVKELKKGMPEGKMLALAMSSWQFKPGLFPHDALDYVDMIEMMGYDYFEERGYHSTFQHCAVDIAEEVARWGLSKHMHKINLGIPFYSRPTDGSAYWGDFKTDVDEIGYSNNVLRDIKNARYKVVSWDPYVEELLENPVLYYNSPQMVYDKTNYCIDNNFGGVMIWHLGSDISLKEDNSLLGAIGDAIGSRKAV